VVVGGFVALVAGVVVLVVGLVVLPPPPHPARMSEAAARQVMTDTKILGFILFLLFARITAISKHPSSAVKPMKISN
jgi:membrane-bound ClpP family serine protease